MWAQELNNSTVHIYCILTPNIRQSPQKCAYRLNTVVCWTMDYCTLNTQIYLQVFGNRSKEALWHSPHPYWYHLKRKQHFLLCFFIIKVYHNIGSALLHRTKRKMNPRCCKNPKLPSNWKDVNKKYNYFCHHRWAWYPL